MMRKFLLATGAILLMSISAAAQSGERVLAAGGEEHVPTPKAEVFAGYSYLRLYGDNHHGGAVSVTGNVNRWFGVTGAFSAYANSRDGGDNVGFVAGGPKFTYRRGPVTPFAEVLVGAAFGGDDTEGAVIGGVGIDAKVSKNVAIRLIQLNYVATTFRSNNGQISAGIVFRIGEKDE
jgi:hypothetical protein